MASTFQFTLSTVLVPAAERTVINGNQMFQIVAMIPNTRAMIAPDFAPVLSTETRPFNRFKQSIDDVKDYNPHGIDV